MSRKRQQGVSIHAVSIVALLALMIFLMAEIFLPYGSVLLWSAVLYLMLRPLYNNVLARLDRTKRFFKFKNQLLAGGFSIGTVVIVAVIFVFLIVNLAGQIISFVNEIIPFINSHLDFFKDSEAGQGISDLVFELSAGTIDLAGIDFKAQLISLLRQYSNRILSASRSLVSNMMSFVVSLCFMCFSLFFFYMDGSYLANLLISAIPISKRQSRALIRKFRDVLGNLVQGLFLVALYQALAAFIIFSCFRITGALLFAILLFFCSFVPMFGCAIVWLPLGIMVAATRGILPGFIFVVLCAVLISFMDNFLRPFLLKDRIKIHPLLIFFSMIGGIDFFGINGLILGPMTVILFFTIVDMVTGHTSDGGQAEKENTAPPSHEAAKAINAAPSAANLDKGEGDENGNAKREH